MNSLTLQICLHRANFLSCLLTPISTKADPVHPISMWQPQKFRSWYLCFLAFHEPWLQQKHLVNHFGCLPQLIYSDGILPVSNTNMLHLGDARKGKVYICNLLSSVKIAFLWHRAITQSILTFSLYKWFIIMQFLVWNPNTLFSNICKNQYIFQSRMFLLSFFFSPPSPPPTSFPSPHTLWRLFQYW